MKTLSQYLVCENSQCEACKRSQDGRKHETSGELFDSIQIGGNVQVLASGRIYTKIKGWDNSGYPNLLLLSMLSWSVEMQEYMFCRESPAGCIEYGLDRVVD